MGESTCDKFPIKNSDHHNVARRENLVPVNYPKLRCTTREILSFIVTHLWIMTAVIKISESGTLSAIQVGPVELVTALNAATSTWGWFGGLSGVQRLFSYVRKQRATNNIEALVKQMRIEPITCQVLTSYGIVRLDDLDTRHAFGGSLETQLL